MHLLSQFYRAIFKTGSTKRSVQFVQIKQKLFLKTESAAHILAWPGSFGMVILNFKVHKIEGCVLGTKIKINAYIFDKAFKLNLWHLIISKLVKGLNQKFCLGNSFILVPKT